MNLQGQRNDASESKPIAVYGIMHRKANEVFVCIREGFACACS